MAPQNAKRDQNWQPVIQGETNDANRDTRSVKLDPVTDRILVNATISGDVNLGNLTIRLYNDGTYDYVCKAAPGTAVNVAYWQVKRIDSTGNVLFADGDSNFDNLATSQAVVSALTYS